jgi:hypothetical protein
MKPERIIGLVLVPIAATVLQGYEVRGQVMSTPPIPSSAIPLETGNPNVASGAGMSAATSPPAPAPAGTQTPGKQSPVYSSNQSHPGVGWAEIGRLRNPYEWGSPQEKGWFFPHYWARKRAEAAEAAAATPWPAMGGMPQPQAGMGAPGAGAAAAPGAPSGAPPGTPEAPGGPAAGEAAAAAMAAEGPGFGGAAGGGASLGFNMIGDQSALRFNTIQAGSGNQVGPIPPPGARSSSAFFPSVRSFKISENQSPRPQDRIFFDFNYYNNLNATIDRRDQVPIAAIKAYRYIWGFEKTFNDGKGSIGMRLPLNTVTADSVNGNLSTPTSSALGDLTIFGKYILEQNPRTGSLISVGLALTPPTAGTQFAGSKYLFGLNTFYFQPNIGYIWNAGRFYLQGFSALDVPVSTQDVTMLYNDIGFGYYAYRAAIPDRFLSAVAPTFEVHINNPLNHRDPFNRFDIAGSPDVVNLTYGLNFLFQRTAVMTFALVTPVTSPKPFDTEAVLLFNWYFGRTRANPLAIQPPMVQ